MTLRRDFVLFCNFTMCQNPVDLTLHTVGIITLFSDRGFFNFTVNTLGTVLRLIRIHCSISGYFGLRVWM